jgi:hypothetical protein
LVAASAARGTVHDCGSGVFLLVPVTVLFALYPGLVTLVSLTK